MLKTDFTPDTFENQVNKIYCRYNFFDAGTVREAPFCPCESTFSIDNYVFQIINLDAYRESTQIPYAAAIATNETDSSILYLFISSDSFQYMGFDGITQIIWPYIGVSI